MSETVSLIHQNPGRTVAPSGSVFPDDAHAIIYRPCRSAMTSGKRRTREWKLRFERRKAPFIEPLMGWTGGEDPIASVELSFPSLESAICYARRQGLRFSVTTSRPDNRRRARLSCGTPTRMQWIEQMAFPTGLDGGRTVKQHYIT
jgi:hypothetical protein